MLTGEGGRLFLCDPLATPLHEKPLVSHTHKGRSLGEQRRRGGEEEGEKERKGGDRDWRVRKGKVCLLLELMKQRSLA